MSEDLKTKVETVLEELNNEALGGVDKPVLEIVRQALLSQKVGTTPQDTMLAARDLFDRAKSKLELWNERRPTDAQRARQQTKASEADAPAMDLANDKNVGDAVRANALEAKAPESAESKAAPVDDATDKNVDKATGKTSKK